MPTPANDNATSIGPFIWIENLTNEIDLAYNRSGAGASIYFLFALLEAFPFVYGAVFLSGVTGNILAIIIAGKYRNMKSLNSTLVVFLAITDLSFLLIRIPLILTDFYLIQYMFGDVWCKIIAYMEYVSAYASIYILCLMSLDRFGAIVYPLKSKQYRTRKCMNTCIISIMLISLTLSSPALVLYKEYNVISEFSKFSFCSTENVSLHEILIGCYCVLSYCLPLIALVLIHTAMFVTIRRQNQFQLTCHGRKSSQHTKAATIVLVIVVAFFVCYTPLNLNLMYTNFGQPVMDDYVLRYLWNEFGRVLAYTNSCLNPIFYTFICKEYRDKLMMLVKCGR